MMRACQAVRYYASLMAFGFSLEAFERLMAIIVSTGYVVKRGQLYFYVDPKSS